MNIALSNISRPDYLILALYDSLLVPEALHIHAIAVLHLRLIICEHVSEQSSSCKRVEHCAIVAPYS